MTFHIQEKMVHVFMIQIKRNHSLLIDRTQIQVIITYFRDSQDQEEKRICLHWILIWVLKKIWIIINTSDSGKLWNINYKNKEKEKDKFSLKKNWKEGREIERGEEIETGQNLETENFSSRWRRMQWNKKMKANKIKCKSRVRHQDRFAISKRVISHLLCLLLNLLLPTSIPKFIVLQSMQGPYDIFWWDSCKVHLWQNRREEQRFNYRNKSIISSSNHHISKMQEMIMVVWWEGWIRMEFKRGICWHQIRNFWLIRLHRMVFFYFRWRWWVWRCRDVRIQDRCQIMSKRRHI